MSLINPSNAELFDQVAEFARANWALFEDVGFGREDLIKLDAVVRTARDPNSDYYSQADPELDHSGPSVGFLLFALTKFKDSYVGDDQTDLRRQAEHLEALAGLQLPAIAGALRSIGDFGLLEPSIRPIAESGHARIERLLKEPDMMAPWEFLETLATALADKDLLSLAPSIADLLAYVLMERGEKVKDSANCRAGCFDHTIRGTSLHLGGPGVVEAYHAGLTKDTTGWEAVLTGMHVVQRMLKEAGAKEILSHEGCSACAWVFSQLSDEERARFTSSDDVGMTFAQLVATNLGIIHRHIDFKHHEPPRLVFYTGAWRLLLDGVLENVPFASVTRSTPEAGRTNLATALKVAMALHQPRTLREVESLPPADEIPLQRTRAAGEEIKTLPGDPLTKSRPLLIVPVGGALLAARDLKAEAQEIASIHGDKVVVLDGFDISEPPQSSGSGGPGPADKTGESSPVEDGADASAARADVANGDLGFTSPGLLSCLVDGASSMVHPPHLALGTRALTTGATRFVRSL